MTTTSTTSRTTTTTTTTFAPGQGWWWWWSSGHLNIRGAYATHCLSLYRAYTQHPPHFPLGTGLAWLRATPFCHLQFGNTFGYATVGNSLSTLYKLYNTRVSFFSPPSFMALGVHSRFTRVSQGFWYSTYTYRRDLSREMCVRESEALLHTHFW